MLAGTEVILTCGPGRGHLSIEEAQSLEEGNTPRPGIEPGFSVWLAEIITAALPRIWMFWEGKKNRDLGKIWRAGE
jgi:hypothetical protein